jgi:hypothetical protein
MPLAFPLLQDTFSNLGQRIRRKTMARIRPLTNRTPGFAISVEGIEEVVSLLRMILALFKEANEILGVSIPRKD